MNSAEWKGRERRAAPEASLVLRCPADCDRCWPGNAESSEGKRESRRPRRAPRGLRAFRSKMRQRSQQMQIAQAARAFLDIRLAVVQRVLILGVADARELNQMLAQFRSMLFQKCGPLVGEIARADAASPARYRRSRRLTDRSRFCSRNSRHSGNSANRVIQAQTRIPQQAHALGQRLAQRNPRRFALEQNHNIHGRIRKRFAPSVSASGQHHRALRKHRFDGCAIRCHGDRVDTGR